MKFSLLIVAAVLVIETTCCQNSPSLPVKNNFEHKSSFIFGVDIREKVNGFPFKPNSTHEWYTAFEGSVYTNKERPPWITWETKHAHCYMFSGFTPDKGHYYMAVENDKVVMINATIPNQKDNYLTDKRLFKRTYLARIGKSTLEHVATKKYIGMTGKPYWNQTALLVEEARAQEWEMNTVKLSPESLRLNV